MMKIFDQAKDKNVAAYVFYGKTADKKLYYESDYKTQVTQSVLQDAFKKGRMLVIDGNTTLAAVSLAANKVSTVSKTASTVDLTEWSAVAE